MSKSEPEKKWEELTLDEKLSELGFPRADGDYDFTLTVAQTERLHAALDQLLDAGETLNTIEEWSKPVGTGTGGDGDALNTLVGIYELVSGGEDAEEEDDDDPV